MESPTTGRVQRRTNTGGKRKAENRSTARLKQRLKELMFSGCGNRILLYGKRENIWWVDLRGVVYRKFKTRTAAERFLKSIGWHAADEDSFGRPGALYESYGLLPDGYDEESFMKAAERHDRKILETFM